MEGDGGQEKNITRNKNTKRQTYRKNICINISVRWQSVVYMFSQQQQTAEMCTCERGWAFERTCRCLPERNVRYRLQVDEEPKALCKSYYYPPPGRAPPRSSCMRCVRKSIWKRVIKKTHRFTPKRTIRQMHVTKPFLYLTIHDLMDSKVRNLDTDHYYCFWNTKNGINVIHTYALFGLIFFFVLSEVRWIYMGFYLH